MRQLENSDIAQQCLNEYRCFQSLLENQIWSSFCFTALRAPTLLRFISDSNLLFFSIVKLKSIVRRRDLQRLQFRPTGACSRSSGCSRRRYERAFSSQGCSAATLPACATTIPGRIAIMSARWPTTLKWLPSSRNCKSITFSCHLLSEELTTSEIFR